MKKNKITIAIFAVACGISINSISDEYTIKINLNKESIKEVSLNWVDYEKSTTEWSDNGEVYDCSNWSPESSSVNIGEKFTQTATDCKQDQSRIVQEREMADGTSNIRDKGDSYSETRTINVTKTRENIGSAENWITSNPSYTEWVNIGNLTGCSNWSPNPSTKTATETFNQTANNCSQAQTRNRQNQEIETTTGQLRDVGNVIVENKTLTNQTATRVYKVTLGAWTNSGSVTGCSNWSPDVSTVNVGQTFTQTATNCSQNQTRSRSESYTDHITKNNVQVSNTTETKTLTNQTSTRSATGTKSLKDCRYKTSYPPTMLSMSGYYNYDSNRSSTSSFFYWDGVALKRNADAYKPFTLNGYTYTVGDNVTEIGDPNWDDDWSATYYVCREPV